MTTTNDLVNKTNNSVPKSNSLLPSMIPSGIGFFGSPYNPADAMLTPSQIGVRVGDSMSDVIAGIKGVGFYADQIGFGAPSTKLTKGMPIKPLGINYFMKTGSKCSNGADMWYYMRGIPDGNALGEKMKRVMAEMNMPPLRGLAPGMIEDAKNALNPAPLMGALFGSGYPKCKQVELMVGDAYGIIKDPDTGEKWLSDDIGIRYTNGGYVQKKWIQDTSSNGAPINLTREQWESEPKGYNPDGTVKKVKEKFEDITQTSIIVIIGIVCLLGLGCIKH